MQVGRWRWQATITRGMTHYGEDRGSYATTRKRCIGKAMRVVRKWQHQVVTVEKVYP